MKDLHPNLPPISFPLLTILDWIIIVIFVGLIIYLFLKKKQKREVLDKKVVQEREPIFPRFSLAKELKNLAKLKSAKKWKEFVLRATEILKKYLEQKYQEPFLFATGTELIQELKNKVSEITLENFRRFFQLVDPVKFADRNLADKQAEKVLQFLKEIK